MVWKTPLCHITLLSGRKLGAIYMVKYSLPDIHKKNKRQYLFATFHNTKSQFPMGSSYAVAVMQTR